MLKLHIWYQENKEAIMAISARHYAEIVSRVTKHAAETYPNDSTEQEKLKNYLLAIRTGNESIKDFINCGTGQSLKK